MSSDGVTDYEQVLHLQQVDIESSIASKIRIALRINAEPMGVQKGDNACWRPNRNIEVDSRSDIVLTVKMGHKPFRKDGEIRISGSDAWQALSGSEVLISRSTTLFKQPVNVKFTFCVPSTKPTSEAAFAALQKVWEDSKGYRSLIGSSKLQQSFDNALKIGVALSEMDPFTKAAFALARTTFELLKEQQRYDELILKLVDGFKNILPFATIVALDVEMSKTLQVIVEDLFDIVEKGAQFICNYVKRTSINRLIVSLFSSEDRDFINRLQERLSTIKEDFDRSTAVEILQTVHDTRERSLLQERLAPVGSATYDPNRGCFEGTRQDILPEIFKWARDSSSPEKILWLYGIPGSGKTSVASSLCDMLHSSKNLAASFFCRRDDPILSKPESVLPTLIYCLASAWGPYRKLVVKALHADSTLRPNQTRRLFNDLVAGPLQTLNEHPKRQFVIVVDALDECGDAESRRNLLSNMLAAASRVGWLKVILTSRPDHDIEEAFTGLGSDSCRRLDLYNVQNAHTDIRLFAKEKLASLAKHRHIPNWPSEEQLDVIMKRSAGLFISVQTMWLLIRDRRRPDELLNRVLEGKSTESADDQLYELYKAILDVKVGLDPQDVHDFRQIIGAVVAVADRRALCDDTLAALLEMEPHVVKSMVDDLESLFYREGQGRNAVRVRHLSIIDFLSGTSCPREFRVDIQQVDAKLARGSFKIMARELKFNICRLRTSSLVNSKVTDMDDRLDRRISDGLLYSCIHWANHLDSTSQSLFNERTRIEQVIQVYRLNETSLVKLLEQERQAEDPVAEYNGQTKSLQELLTEKEEVSAKLTAKVEGLKRHKEKEKKFRDDMVGHVQQFMRQQFLFWLEVLSVSKQVGLTSRMLSLLLRWTQISDQDNAMARDMLEFVSAFASVISQSAPHIYLSALPFAPRNSAVSKCYKKLYPRTLKVQSGGHSDWPPVQRVLFGHSHTVNSVAFSPDNSLVVSSSEDYTIRLWNAETGEGIGEPFKGHTEQVSSVAFSHDGKRVVSGSWDETIRIWDAETGKAVGEPFEGHTDSVTSVAFSHDGKRIVSGSWDETIRIWDAETGKAVGEPFEGHTGSVTSVAFSHEGKRIVSGSNDKTIRIWDAETGKAVGEPFEGHTHIITSVAYSHDGKRVVSGSDDKTIRIWDAESGKAVGEPFEGHTDSVTSVAFSHDGKRIVSGSWDETIRIWDAETGKAVGEPFEGHTDSVTSVAFSHDGKRIVSGSDDKTIRIWDAETGKAVGEPFEGHTDSVTSAAFSHDGKRIVSGSHDKTIRIWDAESGKAVGEPFEGHTDSVTSVAFSHDGKRIVSGSWDETIRIWDAETGKAVGEPFEGHTGSVTSVAFSHDRKRIVSGSNDKTIRIWDAETGKAVGEPFEGHTHIITSVAYSHDGKRVVSGSHDKTIRIWDAESGKAVGEPFEGHTDSVISVTLSHDGKRIVSGSWDKTIRIWDAGSGKAVGEPFEGHTDSVTAVAFSHDGKRIVSGSDDKTIRIWDTESGKAVGEPFEGHTNSVRSVAFSHDGKRIVSGSWDETIRIWGAETGKAVGEPFEGHTNSVRSVAFSHDRKRIVSGSDDKTIRIWDTESGKAVGEPFEGHTNSVRSVAFSHDRKRIVSGSFDQTVRIWDVESGKAVGEPFNGHTNAVTSTAFSHEGKYIVSGSIESTVRVLDAKRREPTNSSHFTHNLKMVDGWVLDSNCEQLFWVPPQLHPGLFLPGVISIIGRFVKTRLDLENFVHGESWAQCKDDTDG